MTAPEDFINNINRSTSIKNAVFFNIRTHIRMERNYEYTIPYRDLSIPYFQYPPIASRRLIEARSYHYPLLRLIYRSLPDRLMFYIPNVHYKIIARSHNMKLVHRVAYICLYNYMRTAHKYHTTNELVPREDLKPDFYSSLLHKYMPDYYYIYKATKFDTAWKQYYTINNYHFNNYTIFYLLIISLIIITPIYIDIYSIEKSLIYTHSQYIKFIAVPNYDQFIHSFLKEYWVYMHYVYSTVLAFNNWSINLPEMFFVESLRKVVCYAYNIHYIIPFLDNPVLRSSPYWTTESTVFLMHCIYPFEYFLHYTMLTIYGPLNTLLALTVNYLGLIHYYYYMPILTIFILFLKHSVGGMSQVIKDYVGNKGAFYISYTIAGLIIFILYMLLSFSIYKEEPLFITNIVHLSDELIDLAIYFFWYYLEVGKGFVYYTFYFYVLQYYIIPEIMR